MTEKEKIYYQKIKNNPEDYLFDRLFRLNSGRKTEPLPGVQFRLINDIPFIEDSSFIQPTFSSPILTEQSPLESIKIAPKKDTYTSPFFEKNMPENGNEALSNTKISVFDDASTGQYKWNVKLYDAGSEVYSSYTNTQAEANEIILFCEKTPEEKSNLFGTFLMIKMGDDFKNMIRKLMHNSKKGKEEPLYICDFRYNDQLVQSMKSYEDLTEAIYLVLSRYHGIDISKTHVNIALTIAYTEQKITLNYWRKSIKSEIGKYFADINRFIEENKFTKEDYTPTAKKPEQLTQISDFLLPTEVTERITGFLGTGLNNLLEQAGKYIPIRWKNRIQKIYFLIKQGMELVTNITLKETREEIYLLRALVMGFINGLFSLIQLLLTIIEFIVTPSGYDEIVTGETLNKYRSYLEMVEDIYDTLSANASSFFSSIKTLIKDFSKENLESVLEIFTDKLKGFTKYDYAFFAGSLLFEVVIGVIIALFTGGSSAIVQSGQKLTKFLSLIARETLSTATMGIVDILQLFKILIAKFVTACSKGWKGFKNFIEKILHGNTDEIVKTEGRVFDTLNELERRMDDLFDHLGGRLYTEKELKLLKQQIKVKYGVDLRLINKEKGFQKLPVTEKGKTKWIYSRELLKDWNKRGVVGKFHEGPPPVIVLRSNNASELTVFHEKVHMEVWFNKLPKMHIVDEEKYVFDTIFKAKDTHKWTNPELIDAYDYINEIIRTWNKTGKKFPFVRNEYIEQLKWNRRLNF